VTVRAVLVGLPGVGKSTVGRALADELGVPFTDVDEVIERRTGSSAADLLRRVGEARFRAEEEAAVAEALSLRGPAVVATGGGTIESAGSRALLKDEPLVVVLTCPPDVLVDRLTNGGDRPLVAGPTAERLAALTAHRDPLYAEVATASVDATAPVAEVAAAIAELAVRA
jgi:shikimate kinase